MLRKFKLLFLLTGMGMILSSCFVFGPRKEKCPCRFSEIPQSQEDEVKEEMVICLK